ncbi:MAG TPA: hypothetical protein VF195_02170 [Actinomycetota bacterium]
MRWVVGTAEGLVGSEGELWLVHRAITSLAWDGHGWLVLVDGREVLRVHGDEVEAVGEIGDEAGRCLLPTADGVLLGTAHARLGLLRDGAVTMLRSFDEAEGRDEWYTPWGGPPDTRSLSASAHGALFANVHVGGILHAQVPDGVWSPTIEIDADVHQVLADPLDDSHVVAATARGLAETRDAGATWHFTAEGLHAPYARAVALDGDRLFLSASTGPRGGRAALYRREPGADVFERCAETLPDWFPGNIDSYCLAAGEGAIAFGTEDGRVFVSGDGGGSWREVLGENARVTCVGVAASEGPGTST